MRNVRRLGLLVMGLVMMTAASAAFAQQGGPPRGRFQGGPGGGGFGFGGGNAAGLLQMEQIQKELELVDEQLEKLRAIQEETRESMRGMFEGLRDLSEDERRERFASLREKMEEAGKATQAKVDEVLLPHQRDRLKQISLQMQMRRGGSGVSVDAVSDALGLTDAQRDELREREQKVAEELRAKITKAQAEAKDQLLEVLTSEQRAKLQELLGEPFELQAQQFGRGGDRGGDRGGRRRGGDGDNE